MVFFGQLGQRLDRLGKRLVKMRCDLLESDKISGKCDFPDILLNENPVIVTGVQKSIQR